jgi:hypothetical protein
MGGKEMTIELGWWAIPLVMTVASFVWANAYDRPDQDDWYGSMDLDGPLRFVAALIASLVAWFVWALLT